MLNLNNHHQSINAVWTACMKTGFVWCSLIDHLIEGFLAQISDCASLPRPLFHIHNRLVYVWNTCDLLKMSLFLTFNFSQLTTCGDETYCWHSCPQMCQCCHQVFPRTSSYLSGCETNDPVLPEHDTSAHKSMDATVSHSNYYHPHTCTHHAYSFRKERS